MKVTLIAFISMLLFPLIGAGAEYARIPSVESIQVIKIAPQDKRAIVKAADGKMRILQAGETVQGEDKAHAVPGLRIDDVFTDRIVIVESRDGVSSKVIIRFENGKQWIERK